MRKSKFTDAQKLSAIRQSESGSSIIEICYRFGISKATFYYWKRWHSEWMLTNLHNLRQLEDENSKLKMTVMELSREKEILQDMLKERK